FDSPPIPLMFGSDPQLTFDGTNYLLASSYNYATRISTSGALLSPNPFWFGWGTPGSAHSLTYDGVGYLALSSSAYVPNNTLIFGSRASLAGVPIGQLPVSAEVNASAPAVAFASGTLSLIA